MRGVGVFCVMKLMKRKGPAFDWELETDVGVVPDIDVRISLIDFQEAADCRVFDGERSVEHVFRPH